MCEKSAARMRATNPTAAFAEKNCAIAEKKRPTMPKSTSKSAIRSTSGRSPPAIPRSISAATTRGTSNSSVASKSLKSGPRTLCFLYPLRYFKSLVNLKNLHSKVARAHRNVEKTARQGFDANYYLHLTVYLNTSLSPAGRDVLSLFSHTSGVTPSPGRPDQGSMQRYLTSLFAHFQKAT